MPYFNQDNCFGQNTFKVFCHITKMHSVRSMYVCIYPIHLSIHRLEQEVLGMDEIFLC